MNDAPPKAEKTSCPRFALRQLSGTEEGRREHYDSAPIRIGRDESCDLIFDMRQDLEVSQAHCEVRYDGTAFRLVDLGSTNGTWVGTEEVPVEPGPGRILETGEAFELGSGGPALRFEIEVGFFRGLARRLFGRRS